MTLFANALGDALLAFGRLLAVDPIATRAALPRTPGVYLFTEPGTGHLYVGRTRNLRARIAEHCPGVIPRSSVPPATFAVKLARESTGLRPTYQRRGGLPDLFANNPKWREAVALAVVRIREMEVRFVEESDPLRSALLELMVAAELQTRFNSFETT